MARRLKLINKSRSERWAVEIRIPIQGTPTWVQSGFSGAESTEPPLWLIENNGPGSKLANIYRLELAKHGLDNVRLVRRFVETTVQLVEGTAEGMAE